ncbi:unnamed protein product [Rotaria sordida]|uniref:Uncharacterized protein n=1 Tax=Rotaria sordida TaxID=392033 RepID=A0A814P7W7_9BILA|nr:unnamed protein product [Rotaria sordida]
MNSYPEEQNIWELKQNVDCPDLIDEYENHLLKKPRFTDNDSSSLLLTKPIGNNKSYEFNKHHETNPHDKPSLLYLFGQHIAPLSGGGNARQWFIQLDTKFFELNLSFHDAIIWYSLHKDKIKCYTELCRLCALEYFQLEKSPHRSIFMQQKKNKSLLLNSTVVINDNLTGNTLNCPNDNPPSVVCYHETSTDSNSKHVFNSILSPTISKAVVDRFIKDPTKFSGKLNLIHIYLKGEAHEWFKQYPAQLRSWSIFINEIAQSFTSILQRDLAFTN